MREKLERAGRWLKAHSEAEMPLCIALAALAVLVGVSLCALRMAPVPADRDAAAQETISAIEEREIRSVHPDAAEERRVHAVSPDAAEEKEIQTVSPDTERTSSSGNGLNVVPGEEQKENIPEGKSNPEPEKGETSVSPKREEITKDPVAETPPAVSEPPHEHNWIPVTVTVHHDAVTHVVHHDAVMQSVHHDTETHEEPVYEYRTICDTCGTDITGQIPDHIGPVCQGSYSVQRVQMGINVAVDREEYDEEVTVQNAWDETVTDRQAYDEEITTGYRCGGCGEWKEP